MEPLFRLEEEEYLRQVLEVVRVKIEDAENEVEQRKGSISNVNFDVNDLLSNAVGAYNEVSETDDYDFAESFDAIVELASAERDAREQAESVAMILRELMQLHSQQNSAYFGRIDFRGTSGDFKTYYIGRFGLVDRERFIVYTVDWRSPVASVFYDFDVGVARYETPNGWREGALELKRQFKIARGTIEYMFDSDVRVTDEILARALSESSGDKLKVIIGSIQRDQNAAIRHDPHGALVVTGPAGSGKTSVGMHRLAWLLYRDRENLKSGEIVTISSSAVFASYIADVLPELGEEDINREVFGDVIKPYLPVGYKFTDSYELARYITSAQPDDTRVTDAEILYSRAFMDYIEAYFQSCSLVFRDVSHNGKLIISAERLSELTRGSLSLGAAVSKVTMLINTLCDEFFREHEKSIKSTIETESDEVIFDNEIDIRFFRQKRDIPRRAIESFLEANGLLDAVELYERLLTSYLDGSSPETPRRLRRRIAERELLYEDAAVVLRILTLSGAIEQKTRIKYVLLDEAQDYGYPELLFLRHLYSRAGFTVLIDPHQAIYPAVTTPDTETIAGLFGGAVRRLENSYRCTRSIFDFARRFVGLPGNSGYNRDGDDVSLLSGDAYECVAEILRSDKVKSGTVGIITATRLRAVELHKQLKSEFKIRSVQDPDVEFSGGISIMPVALVKGLEFDTAIIADDFSYWDERFRGRLFYTLCTRALHRLYIIGNENVVSGAQSG